MEVEFVSGTADEDLVARVFRVQNISRVSGVGAPGWGLGGLERPCRGPRGPWNPGTQVSGLPASAPDAGGAPAGATLPVPALVRLPGHA